MTCMNLWLEGGRALLAVDTAVGHLLPQGKAHQASKVMLLPHAGIAFAGTGTNVLFQTIVSATTLMAIHDYDSAIERMPEMLVDVLSQLPTIIAAVTSGNEEARAALAAASNRQELLVVGWSARRDSMEASLYTLTNVAAGFEHQRIEGKADESRLVACPWDESIMGPLPAEEFDTPNAMQRLIYRQIQFAAAHRRHLLAGFGGSMVTAEITRDSIALRRTPLVCAG